MTLMTAALLVAADIFMMGDSTMCDRKPDAAPQEGWGQRLRTFTKDGVKVNNRAVGDAYRSFDPEKPDPEPSIPPSGKTDLRKPEGS